ncbi:hypothetical protein PtB15_7B304 [Puccinia triticina]|nr:hypothetical protein PtB15_7B304 [Puccinia triticina]
MFSLLLLSVLAAAVHGQANSTSSSAAGTPSSSGGPMALASGLSPGCQAAAGSLLTSDFGACANIMGLVSVIGAPGSVVPPLTTWISAVCAAAPCSPDTLRTANQTVASGCTADIQKGSAIATALQTIVSNYSGAKDLLCTQYAANSTFCIPSVLANVQAATGQNITVSEVTALLTGSATPAGQAFAAVSPGAYCTDCGHALVTQSAAFMAASSAQSSPAAMASISASCGPAFVDGKLPPSVRNAAKTAADAAKNAAPSLSLDRAALLLPAILLAALLV